MPICALIERAQEPEVDFDEEISPMPAVCRPGELASLPLLVSGPFQSPYVAQPTVVPNPCYAYVAPPVQVSSLAGRPRQLSVASLQQPYEGPAFPVASPNGPMAVPPPPQVGSWVRRGESYGMISDVLLLPTGRSGSASYVLRTSYGAEVPRGPFGGPCSRESLIL